MLLSQDPLYLFLIYLFPLLLSLFFQEPLLSLLYFPQDCLGSVQLFLISQIIQRCYHRMLYKIPLPLLLMFQDLFHRLRLSQRRHPNFLLYSLHHFRTFLLILPLFFLCYCFILLFFFLFFFLYLSTSLLILSLFVLCYCLMLLFVLLLSLHRFLRIPLIILLFLLLFPRHFPHYP